MARRRYISTNISTDPKVNILAEKYGDFAALLYTWMIPHVEDNATLTGDPDELMYKVVPALRSKTREDVINALEAMVTLKLIIWDKDKRIIHFPADNFYKYQRYVKHENRINKNEQPESAKNASNSVNISSLTQSAENTEEQRKTTENTASFPSSFPPSFPPSVNIFSSEPSSDTTQTQPIEKPKSKQAPVFSEDTEQYQLALFMRQCVLENLPNAKVPEETPKSLKRWTHDIDLMIRIDNRNPNDIRDMMDWAHKDEFWRANVLCPSNLREKWDRLVAQKQRVNGKTRGDPAEPKSWGILRQLYNEYEQQEKGGYP